MSWQLGTTILGLGLAILSLVAPMMGLTLPRWLLEFLLGLGCLLILIWPVSAATAWLIHDLRQRAIARIRIGGILVLIVFLAIWSIGRDGSTSQLVVESMPSSSTIVPQGNQRCPTKVARLAKLKLKNLGVNRITRAGLVVLKTNDFEGGRLQLPVSSMDTLFDCPLAAPIEVFVDLNPGDDALFDAVVECNGTFAIPGEAKCPKGALAVPSVNNSKILLMTPVKGEIARFDDFTVRASADMTRATVKTFHVLRSTDGSIELKDKRD